MNLTRCKTCCMPNTRPDTEFADGECSACISYRKRPQIDWAAREQEFKTLLDRHDGKCIVPSSGGKDSTYQVLKLLELGADVTIVTAATCMLTDIGRQNIDNLSRFARTIEVRPNRTVRATLNRLGLQMVGDVSWPEHCSIFNIPFKVAIEKKIPLIIYGENPQENYGGPIGSDQAKIMSRRWVSEFGGFLGLRPQDLIGIEDLTANAMADYLPPKESDVAQARIEAHFLGQYFEWDGARNAEIAIKNGMKTRRPSFENWWDYENLDNALHGIHDYFGWLKYGYGRGCAQISVDIRKEVVTRDFAMDWVVNDHCYPQRYMGVSLDEMLDHIGMTRANFNAIARRYTNRAIHAD